MSPSFQGPSALDLLACFTQSYLSVIDGRRADLRARLAGAESNTGKYERLYDELRDELRTLDSFQPALHRLITAFVAEALKPWQELYTDVVVRDVHPLLFRTIK